MTEGNLKQAAEPAVWLLLCLWLSISIAYLLVYGEPNFDRVHAELGVSPDVTEIALWCVVLLFYAAAIVHAWMLKSELKTYRLGHRCAFLFAVLLTAPVVLAVLLIGVLFLWKELTTLTTVGVGLVIMFGFQSWLRRVKEDNYKKYLTIVNILTEIQQSVRNIEKEKTEPRAG